MTTDPLAEFTGRDQAYTCPFCRRIAAGQVNGTQDGIVWFEPLGLVRPGRHMLYIPVEHIEIDLDDPQFTPGLAEAAARATRVAITQTVSGACNMIWDFGTDATQTVPHPHLHVVRRRRWDWLPLPWTGQRAWWRRARLALTNLLLRAGGR